MVRVGRSLERIVKEKKSELACQVRYWEDAWEVEEFFKSLTQ